MSVPTKKKPNSSIQNVEVVVRVRPLNDEENQKKARSVVQCVSSKEIHTKEKKYHFDRVFPPNSTQMDLYSYVVSPMISDVIAGYNCTVFAYGQTGTGKTHTMIGGDPCSDVHWKDDELAGCIPRAAANIFDKIALMDIINYTVRVSFLELYNEEVRDLLNKDDRSPPLNIFNDSKGSVYIQGLSEFTVSNSNDIYTLLREGTNKRQTACTLVNNHSSRSHTVFTITVHTRESTITGEEVLKTGKLNLVDLAGSENIAKSGAKDKRALESANINKSLLTLGRVIQILAERNNKHVPYRDSKLTRILQDSLGGHTKTCIIATVSPCRSSYDETVSTLEYACRARDIKNTPTINEKVTKAQMIKELTSEIDKLRKDLDAARSGNGFYIDKDNWEKLNVERQNITSVMALKNEMIDNMKQKILELEVVRETKLKEFDEIMKECHKREKIIGKATKLLKDKTISLKQEEYVSNCYARAVSETATKANELLETTQKLSTNQAILQQKLEAQYFNNYHNEQLVKEKTNNLLINLNAIKEEEDLLTFNNITLTELQSLKEIAQNAISQKVLWKEDRMPSLISKFEVHCNISNEITEHSKMVIRKAEDIVDNVFQNAGSLKNKSNELLEHFKEYENKASNKIKNFSEMIESVKTCLEREKDQQHDILRFTQNRIDNLECMINMIDDFTVNHLSSDDNILDQKASEIKENLFELQKDSSVLEEHMKYAKMELTNDKQSYDEYEKLLDLESVKEQMIESTDDLVEHISDSMVSKINSVEASCKTQEESIKLHNEKVDNILRKCNDTISSDILINIKPVQRAGDTPKQHPLNYPKRISEEVTPREALIKKFKDEFVEDIENQSFHLNCSTDSFQNLDDSISSESN